jgi:hypothetical protein
VCIGEVCLQKRQSQQQMKDYVLALATLGDATQIGSFLFLLLGQGKQGRQYRVVISLNILHANFAKVYEPLWHFCTNVANVNIALG